MKQIDKKDRKILAELDLNARMPLTQLAKKVGLSRQVVEYRIKRMQEENIILGAKTIFDSVVVGFSWYRLAIRLLNVTIKQKDELIEYLKQHKNIFWLGETGGNWDLVMNFICKDNFEFNRIFEEIITKHGSLMLDYEVLIYVDVHDFERSYILNKKRDRREFFHKMKQNPSIQLDDLDREIIRRISKDALITNLQLGQELNVSGNTIRNRIRDMEKSKLILGFRLFVNPLSLGYQSHFLFLAINRLDLEKEKKLQAYLKNCPNVTFVTKHIGKWRIGMEIETKTEEDFQKIFVEIRGEFSDMITDFMSFPLFKDHIINYFPDGCL